jgi:hypothetical protein
MKGLARWGALLIGALCLIVACGLVLPAVPAQAQAVATVAAEYPCDDDVCGAAVSAPTTLFSEACWGDFADVAGRVVRVRLSLGNLTLSYPKPGGRPDTKNMAFETLNDGQVRITHPGLRSIYGPVCKA